jgi:hypothetical protein
MHRILFLPDFRPAGYLANPNAGYRISGKGRIPYWISLTLAGYPDGYPVSGLTGYPAGQSGIRSDTGYKKGRISGASL